MTRPWRLTRRERVAMEAALATMRLSAITRYLDPRDLHRVLVRLGCALEAAPGIDARTPYDDVRRIERAWWRVLRARVAIALRAALRADEDARCEAAHIFAFDRAVAKHVLPLARAQIDGSLDALDAVRDWPQVILRPKRRVPLALWERPKPP
jgi:hypothetical protein